MCDEIFACGLVEVIPKSLDVVTNVTNEISISTRMSQVENLLDRHDTNACQQAHQNPKLPELQLGKQRKSSNV